MESLPSASDLCELSDAVEPSFETLLQRVTLSLLAWRADARVMQSQNAPFLLVVLQIFASEVPFIDRLRVELKSRGYTSRFDSVRHQLSISTP